MPLQQHCGWISRCSLTFSGQQYKENIVPEATKVDGSVVTWQKAVDAMNTALQNAGSKWRYELKGALPTLRKQ